MNQVHGRDVAVVDGPWGDAAGARGRRAWSPPAPTSPSPSSPPTACRCCSPTRSPGSWPRRTPDGPGWSPASSRRRRGDDHTGRRPGAGSPPCSARRSAAGATKCPTGCGDEVAAAVPEAYAETSWGTPAVDVAAGVHAQLAALGVRATGAPGRLHPGVRPTTSPTAASASPDGSPATSGWTAPSDRPRAPARPDPGARGRAPNSPRTWPRWRTGSPPPARRPAGTARR